MALQRWSCVAALLLAVTACAGQEDGADDGTPTPTTSPSPSPTPSPSPSPTPTLFDLSFNGTGFGGPHGGQDFGAAVVECSSGAEPCTGTIGTNGRMTGTVPAAGNFELLFDDVLEVGPGYELHLWIDFNGNGACDPPSTDHVWAYVVGSVTTNAELAIAHDTSFTNACYYFE